MPISRRSFLRATLAAGTVATAVTAGLLTPRVVLAAWPKQAFEAQTMDDALKGIVGNTALTDSDKLSIKLPDIAENGSIVSFAVNHSIPNAETLSILVAENSSKLAASYVLSNHVHSFVSGRIKMRKTSEVVAVIKAGDTLYSTRGKVKVTLGGCGG